MLVAPDHQVHPFGYILRVEGLVQGGASSKPFLVPVLVEHEYLHIVVDVALWRLEPHLLLLEHLVQNQVLDVPQPIQRDLTRTAGLGDNQRPDNDLVQVGVFPEIVYIVASLEQIACRNFPKVVGGVVVIAVYREDRQADAYVLIFKVGSVFIAIQGDIEVHLFVAEHIFLENVEASEEALLAGVDFIEQVASQE